MQKNLDNSQCRAYRSQIFGGFWDIEWQGVHEDLYVEDILFTFVTTAALFQIVYKKSNSIFQLRGFDLVVADRHTKRFNLTSIDLFDSMAVSYWCLQNVSKKLAALFGFNCPRRNFTYLDGFVWIFLISENSICLLCNNPSRYLQYQLLLRIQEKICRWSLQYTWRWFQQSYCDISLAVPDLLLRAQKWAPTYHLTHILMDHI